MTYKLKVTNQFKKDLKRCNKRGLPLDKLKTVIDILQYSGCLPAKYKQHLLIGNRKGQWECHIESDWLLIWEQDDIELTLLMINTGAHSDLF